MAEHSHAEWLREGVKQWNFRRKKVDFTPELSNLNFSDFLPPDFRDAPKTSRYFEGFDFSGANLQGADLTNLNFTNAKFKGSDLSGADLSKTNFSGALFVGANLSEVRAFGAVFENALFEAIDFTDVEFHEAELGNAKIIASKLSGNQIKALEAGNAQVFASRAQFKDSISFKRTAVISRAQVESSAELEPADDRTKKNKYDVYFGTNRRPEFAQGEIIGFDGSNDNQINYGICEVIVPERKPIGKFGSRLWKTLFNKQPDILRVDHIVSLDEELFYASLRQASARMKIKANPTIFVHGFNNSFSDAVTRAAQIGLDLGIGQGVALFSWPSKGTESGYLADEAMVETSKYFLADFIEKFVHNSDFSKVNIVAHSMGCRCVMGAVEQLAAGRIEVLKSIDQLILAAADVDTGHMPFLAKHAVGNCARTTSYASREDKALLLSKLVHSFPRVGITPPTFVYSGIDTVVVNNDDLGVLSHQYIGTSRDVLNDIFGLLTRNLAPQERFGLEQVIDGEQHYWRIKE